MMTNCSKCFVQSAKDVGYSLCRLKSIVWKFFSVPSFPNENFLRVNLHFRNQYSFSGSIENMPLFPANSFFHGYFG